MMKNIIIMQIMIIMLISILTLMTMTIHSHNKFIHPIMLGLILLIFAILSSMNLSIYNNNHWFSYLSFMIIIGGLMILFLYFTSFISNMKMSMKWTFIMIWPMKTLLMMMMIFLMMYKINQNLPWFNNFNEIYSNYKLMNMNKLNNKNIQISYMYMMNKNITTLISMIYLLMCMTLIVKICMKKKFSIRKIN